MKRIEIITAWEARPELVNYESRHIETVASTQSIRLPSTICQRVFQLLKRKPAGMYIIDCKQSRRIGEKTDFGKMITSVMMNKKTSIHHN